MDLGTQADILRVLCPRCDTVNHVAGGQVQDVTVCVACKHPLFDGHPIALDQARFERQVADSDLPLLVDFWAPWCAPCRFMAPIFERAAAELEPLARLAKVNTDNEPALAQRLGIWGIPTFAIFRGGNEVARKAGAMDIPEFIAWARSQL